MTLSTLQLARRIADAVVIAWEQAHWLPSEGHPGDLPDEKHPPTQALLRVLHDEGSWFCRLRNDPVKGTITEQMEMFP